MKNMQYLLARVMILCIVGITAITHAHELADEKQLIRHTINSMYDTPEHKVVIDPIVVQGNHAIASWTQHNKGGRALLHRTAEGTWDIVLCSGKAVTESLFLTETGISTSDAEALAKRINAAEANINPATIALFDSFNGVMRNAHGSNKNHDHRHKQH